MPAGRPSISLEPYKAVIWTWYIFDQLTLLNTRDLLRERYPELEAARSQFPSKRTLERTLIQWGPDFKKQMQSLSASDRLELSSYLWKLFYTHGLTDEEIMRFLKKENYEISKRSMIRLRLSLGMFRRIGALEFAKHDAIMRTALEAQLHSGQSSLYGRSLTYQHLKMRGIPVARDRMYKILKELDPIGVESRTFGLQKTPRDKYIVPGPNFLWSVDGHHKLSMYGIEIYAAIDGYSRYITWIHVGISARTPVAILRQYLDIVEETNVLPYAIRSDRGSETPMMANAHWKLHQALNPNTTFKDVYWYGTSTLNVRIESWWRQMSKSQTITWKNHLDYLRDSGLFSDNIQCSIALLYVYLPIIRKEIYEFAELWNAHRIRSQPNRPYHPTGKPFVMYYAPVHGITDYGKKPPLELLQELKADLNTYDPNEYLPIATLEWCRQELETIGIKTPITFEMQVEKSSAHLIAYCHLCSAIENYFLQGNCLYLSEKPQNAYKWGLLPDNAGIVDFEENEDSGNQEEVDLEEGSDSTDIED